MENFRKQIYGRMQKKSPVSQPLKPVLIFGNVPSKPMFCEPFFSIRFNLTCISVHARKKSVRNFSTFQNCPSF